MTNLNETLKAYFAGIFDGEGSIFFSNPPRDSYPVVNVAVGMCDEDIPKLFLDAFGGRIDTFFPKATKGKQAWRWSTTGRGVTSPLTAMHPYLRLKKYRAELALLYASTLKDRGGHPIISEDETILRLNIVEEVDLLNTVGKNKMAEDEI